jgi:hypothetical protein
VTAALTVKLRVATESQPLELSGVFVRTCSGNVNTVPGVRQCTRADRSVGSACYDWVDVRINVATESQPVALTSVSLYVPAAVMLMPFQRYRQRLRTYGSVGSACHDWVHHEDQCGNRVTTRCTYQCILVRTCSSNADAVPGVRQSLRTYCGVGGTGHNWVHHEDQCGDGVTTRCTYQVYPCMYLQ